MRTRADWLVVGAGFTGAVLAERIATVLGQKVVVIEARDHVGGNAYDELDQHGVRVHRYGAHLFHTSSTRVWRHLSRFTEWQPHEHRVVADLDGLVIPLPVNLTSVELLLGPDAGARVNQRLLESYGAGARVPILKLRRSAEPSIRALADVVYQRVFLGYTLKQWALSPEELDRSVTARVPIVLSRDDRYFHDLYQALPAGGYTALFERMLDHPNIEVRTGISYRDVHDVDHGRTVYTGSIDGWFDHAFGPLPYRSLEFEFVHHEIDSFQVAGQVNYPNSTDHTRVLEFKKLTDQEVAGTTIAYERPEAHRPGVNGAYYPIPHPEHRRLHQRYLEAAHQEAPTVVFAGRLADYRYYNMDEAVGHALRVFDRDIAGPRRGTDGLA